MQSNKEPIKDYDAIASIATKRALAEETKTAADKTPKVEVATAKITTGKRAEEGTTVEKQATEESPAKTAPIKDSLKEGKLKAEA